MSDGSPVTGRDYRPRLSRGTGADRARRMLPRPCCPDSDSHRRVSASRTPGVPDARRTDTPCEHNARRLPRLLRLGVLPEGGLVLVGGPHGALAGLDPLPQALGDVVPPGVMADLEALVG